MATKRTPRVAKVYPDEQAIENKMEPLQAKKKGGKELTEKESETLSTLRKELGALRFVRLAKLRTGKAILAIRNVGKLGGAQYVRTEEQVTKLKALLQTAMTDAIAALAPKKSGDGKKAADASSLVDL